MSRPNCANDSELSSLPAGPRNHDPFGIITCGALAFIFSSIAHEAIGHGGAALLTGARIMRISSVYFDAVDAPPIVDAGGPLLNLFVSGLLLVWCHCRRPTSPHGRLLVVALAALNLFWGFGYFFFSALTGRGDWAFLFKHSEFPWIWRGVLLLVGLCGYRRSITVVGKIMTPFAQDPRAWGRPLFRPAILLYLSAGATCCFAALFYRRPIGRALHESVIESFGAFFGLCFVAPRVPNPDAPETTLNVPRDRRWIAVTMAMVALYVSVLGRGYFGGAG